MGKTQRKTCKYLENYRKSFKRKVASVLEFTPPSTTSASFFNLFNEVYPDEVRSMEKHFQFYQAKNKNRRSGKPLYFPKPEQLLFDMARPKIIKFSEATWNPLEAEEKKKTALKKSALEQQKRAEKYRISNISTQEVTPPYLVDLIERYWHEQQIMQRLYVVQECAKYKNSETILFLRQVLSGENDWFIKNVAFRTCNNLMKLSSCRQKERENVINLLSW